MSLISLTPILSQNQDKRDPRMSSLTTSSSSNRTPAPPENPTALLSAVPTIPPLFHHPPFPTSMSTRYSDPYPTSSAPTRHSTRPVNGQATNPQSGVGRIYSKESTHSSCWRARFDYRPHKRLADAIIRVIFIAIIHLGSSLVMIHHPRSRDRVCAPYFFMN